MDNKLIDNHTHSCFSDDSEMALADAVRVAKDNGLGGIVFTDHLDFDPPEGIKCFTFDVSSQQEAIDSVRKELGLLNASEAYKRGEFMLVKGVEIGVQMKSMGKIREVMESHTYDCVIASLHLVDGQDPYYGGYYLPYESHYAYGHYLEQFYENIKEFGDFDILGHYDYIVRYARYEEATIRYSEFRDVLDSILEFLAGNGKVFEINTKTYQTYKGRCPELDLDILKRFRDLGGEALSFGSDAHGTARIGENFEWAREMALKAGIKYEATYIGRQPHYIPL